jgi:release factor glutamine methyltransferase
MTIQEAREQLILSLGSIYDQRESTGITDMVLENITGLKKIDRIIEKNKQLSLSNEDLLEKYTVELLDHKPVQYVLHEAWFYGLKFFVNEHVLIPRPETEELVRWLIGDTQASKLQNQKSLKLLDIGTGSGCIAVALKKQLPISDIDACDISQEALDVAMRNAADHQTKINFMQSDFLNSNLPPKPLYDYIISNPPYIPLEDKTSMRKNVLEYEPHLALFVNDTNPLIFYEAIADFAKKKLSPIGKIFVELHEELSVSAQQLFLSKGFDSVEIKKDMQEKNRLLKATMLL